MSNEKTFDKADLLRFFYEAEGDALVGKFTVIYEPTATQLSFDREASQGEVKKYPVAAETAALHCERYGFAVVVQSVAFPDGGAGALPKAGTLRILARERRVITRYGGTSAQLVRWAMDLADEWRTIVGYAVPADPIDLRRRNERTGDNAPTGETIDDVLAEHDSADADADADESEGA